MKRYLKLYYMLMRTGFISLITYPANFWNNVLASFLWSTLTIAMMMLLTARTATVFGWTREELWLLTGVYNIVFGIIYTTLAANFYNLVRLANKGELDAFLVKPIDSQFSVSLWHVDYSSICRISVGIFFVIYLLTTMHIPFSPVTFILFLLLICCSLVLIYALSFTLMTITLWFTTLYNLTELLYNLNNITKYPQEMYQKASMFLFLILFPLTLIIIIPTKTLLGEASVIEIGSLVICSIVFLLLSRKFWKFALRFYTSASG